ncbi:hypothetical protein, partial [Acutalibacter caecimuris]|uniref:hypothetical protein n=1 Tax=Acutalibacter caecimuris TaxID=3093657 RepID=UPI002AC8D4FC
MNKSKFLKKSLAAFLAILMVAAMIPMSAFAADAPTGVTTIRVNGVSAEWDGEKYVAAVSGTREEAANVPITAVTTGTTNVYVKEKDSEKVDPSTGLTLDLSKAVNADKPATAGDDGTYVFTLLVGESINDPATYELAINWTRTYASSANTVTKVENIADMASAEIGESTITVKMKLSLANLAEIESERFTKDGEVYTKAAGAEAKDDHKIAFVSATPGNVGKELTKGDSNWENPAHAASALLKEIFTTQGASLALAGDKLTVTAANGDTKTYTLKFEAETSFNTIKLGDVEGKISGKTVTFTMPFGTAGADGNDKTAIEAMKLSWTAPKNTTVKIGKTDFDTATATAVSGKNSLTLGELNNDDDTKYVYPLADESLLWIQTASGAKAQINVSIKIPTQNPEAELTAVKVGDSQVVAIEKGQGTVEVTLPAGTDISGTLPLKLAGTEGATAAVAGDANQTATLAANGVLAPTNSEVSVKDKVIYVNVTSPDGDKIVQYTIKLSVGEAGPLTLSKLDLVNADGSVATGVIDQAAKTVTLTVPHSVGKDGSEWTGIKVVAEGSKFASLAYQKATAFTTGAELISGETEAKGDGKFLGNTISGLNTTDTTTWTVVRVWYPSGATGTTADTTTNYVDYKVILRKNNASTGNALTAATFTDAADRDAMTADTTYKAEVTRGTQNIIKVFLPYTKRNITSIKLSDITVSDNLATVAQIPASIDAGTKVNTFAVNPTEKALGKAITVDPAKWVNGLNSDGTVDTTKAVALRVYSENVWDTVGALTVTVDGTGDGNTTSDKMQLASGAKNCPGAYATYYLVAEVAKAESGYDLTSIESTDPLVTVTGDIDAAARTLTLTVPYSYAQNKTPFTLRFEASPMATVAIGGYTLTSDNEAGDNENASKISVDSTNIYVGENSVARSGAKLNVTAEDGSNSRQWTLEIVTAPAGNDAGLKAITAGTAEAVVDTEDESKWTVELPYSADPAKQVLGIEPNSALAKVQVAGEDFDATAEYSLEEPLAITVIAEDNTRKTYTLTATKAAASTEAAITALKVGQVEATINGNDITANIGVDGDLTKQVLTIETSAGATVTVNGEAYEGAEISV